MQTNLETYEVNPVLLSIVDILAEYGAWVIAEREKKEAAEKLRQGESVEAKNDHIG